MAKTEILPEDHPVVVKIKDTICELDSLFETYKNIDIKEHLASAVQQSHSLSSNVAYELVYGGNSSSLVREVASSMFCKLVEKADNEEDGLHEDAKRFYVRLTSRLFNNPESIVEIRSLISKLVIQYFESYDLNQMIEKLIKEKLSDILNSTDLKITLP